MKCCPGNCKDIDCYGGINSESCFRMSKNNCKTSVTACIACPYKYAIFGANHCLICCTRPRCKSKENFTEEEQKVDQKMKMDDEMCHEHHCRGCLCCPFYIPIIPCGILGTFFTWIGSAVCCMTGGCLLCLEKVEASSLLKLEKQNPTEEPMTDLEMRDQQ